MRNVRIHTGRIAARLALVLGCALLLCSSPKGQTRSGHAQVSAPASAVVPPEAQARWGKLEDTLKSAQAAGDAKTEAETLNRIGELLYRTSNYQKALENLSRALTAARSAKNAVEEAAAISGSANCYVGQGEFQKALALYRQALNLATASGDKNGQAAALNGIGWADSNLGQNKEALEIQERALALAREVHDSDLEATILLRTGAVYAVLGDKQKAVDDDNQALNIYRSLGDRYGEAATLNNIGIVYDDLGEKQKALDDYNRALQIRREVGDRDGAAWTLNNIGKVSKALGDNQQALKYYSQALPIFVEVGDRLAEAAMRNNIGAVYREIGEQQKALESYNQAVPIFHQLGDLSNEATTLTNIGNVYYALGEKQRALEFYEQALPIRREVDNPFGEATTLNNIGAVYLELGENKTALETFARSLQIRKNIGDRSGEATTLTNIGNVDYVLGEKRKALEDYAEALSIQREIGESSGEAGTLNNLGFIYESLGENEKALDLFNQALPLATAVADPVEEARILCNLMLNRKALQPALAVFYGKQAVNLLQQVRGNIQGLDKELQNRFLASKEDYYHDLADLLIAQGGLPEAEQVLDFLKQREYSDYVRGDAANALGALTLTAAEKQAQEEYQKSTAQLVALGERWAKLKNIGSRTPELEKEYQKISDQLGAANKELNDYYARLYVLFGKNSDANRQMADVKGDVSVLKQAIAKMPRTVALYTLVGKDRTSIIVITGSATVARETSISEEDLNRKVAQFQQVLRSPIEDPRPMAQEIYKILVGPVKADLDQAGAETLVWSLDGVLRYVPMAALYDGKQYLVENYETVTITPASIAHLAEKPDVSNLNTVAMGISRKYEEGLPALPAVVGELEDVVRGAQSQQASGASAGTILLDAQFTEKAMESQLGSPRGIVHIASHFVFRPGDDRQSYLLLSGKDEGGAGFHLTVAEFRDNQKLALDDTELLTLSACETGMSGSASNGREVDGLGTTAQLKGAKAVMSSLWEVNDASTGKLMGDFYKRWAEGGGSVAKVQALRLAQLDLLQDKVTLQAGADNRGFGAAKPAHDAPAGYSHPYYWAPFVLMGNWR